eukprot:CAMPEP_0119012956 /NCGR_PEP_ID=MMETSP1176-20130426/7717_1 /TAXON_ID=265551 /ORGANISM="Synedropsis recta cf, Strain CCMP1620" /LENGTH=135 /DNA_ID=CAMNT_0006965997 /DNA_START=19 /DNA_END=426 /DNA_ORIENTATION=+
MTTRLIGSYRREPVELPHHRVKVDEDNEDDRKLIWTAEGDKGWSMTLNADDDTLLIVGDDCPVQKDCEQVTVELEEDKVIGLRYNGEFYAMVDVVFELPDDVIFPSGDDDSDSECAVVVGDEPGFGPDDDASTDL